MEAYTQELVSFFLTGRRPGDRLTSVEECGLKPALFAGYRDLTRLRYDFPLLLVPGRTDHLYVQSLSGIVDRALDTMSRGHDGERIAKHAHRVEREIRELMTAGASGALSTLWKRAVEMLASDAEPSFAESARQVKTAINIDGELADCDAALPTRLVQHAWRAVQSRKAVEFRKELDRLLVRLSEILRADYERSDEARSSNHLKETVGRGFGNAFNFTVMSRLLTLSLPSQPMTESRRARLRWLIEVLSTQQFFPRTESSPSAIPTEPYRFLFTRCADALAAFRDRSLRLIELAKAIAIAELEIDGQYSETRHDAFFDQFGAHGLDPEELTAYPDYLVCLNAEKLSPAEHAQLLEILASGLPIKVLVQIDDILQESPNAEGNLTTGTRSRQLANMAIGLSDVFVLQASSSNLFRYRESIVRGLNSRGPALFSVYSGVSDPPSEVPPYLMAAAAVESRAFPAFTYDPSAGPDWASRFSLAANAQAELDWPMHRVTYEDEQHQRVTEEVAFTVVDFMASDRRYAKHLALVPHELWNDRMLPVDQMLAARRRGLPEQVPSLFMVDRDNILQRVIVDERLIREARRCREMWHSLQELGGVHNSHAERLVARERKAWEERMQQEADAHAVEELVASVSAPAGTVSSTASAATTASGSSAAAPAAEPARSPDEAYIETARCSTCNECTQLNGKMFAYDANKQAYIKDINAGTYAQLVEAAESCQVSIIHPGKPRNPNEPGLERLLERAAPFL